MTKKLSAAEKAAVVLLSLGEDLAGDIMSQMTPEEARRIAGAMSRLGRVDDSVVQEVSREFHGFLSNEQKTYQGGAAAAQRLLVKAGRPEDAAALDGQADFASPQLAALLTTIGAKILATYLLREHPQTVAVVLAHCAAKQAGEILRLLPAATHVDVMQRVAHLGAVDPDSIDAIMTSLRSETERLGSRQGQALGGVEKLVALIGSVSQKEAEALLQSLEERDPVLAAKVRLKLFTFNHLVKIAARGMQTLLAQVPQATLRLALKGAGEAVASHVYANLSTRAAQLLRDDVAALPKTRMAEVEAAQQQIAAAALALAASGKLEIMSSDEVYV